jgi:hypothetical protein
MHGLETIIARNVQAAAPAIRRPEAAYLGLIVTAACGVITIKGRKVVNDQIVAFEKIVNASNPLIDGPLCEFHKTWDGPRGIAGQVELLASQHRRIVSAEGLWQDCQAEAAEFNKQQAAA